MIDSRVFGNFIVPSSTRSVVAPFAPILMASSLCFIPFGSSSDLRINIVMISSPGARFFIFDLLSVVNLIIPFSFRYSSNVFRPSSVKLHPVLETSIQCF